MHLPALSRKNLWEATPGVLKSALGAALGMVPPRLLLGKRFRRNLRFLEEAQCWPAERSREYQLDQLRRICALAKEKTRFYRREFEKAGFDPADLKTPEDLAGLPRIDREALREHLDEMCTVSPRSPRAEYVSTGGTGGRQFEFYIDADRSPKEYAYLTASWQRAGYRLGTPLAVFRGRRVSANRKGLHHEYDPILRHHYYSSHHMSDEEMRRYLDHIGGIGPCYLHVYPSAAAALARFVRRARIQPPPNVRGIIAESEIVYLNQRRMVGEVFGCPYFSCYGHSEKLVLAAECEQSTDYHVWPTYGYFELLDEAGQPVTTPGQRGEIVGTGFINTVMPFIRYRTGDEATYVGRRCDACGREHTILREIRGHRPQEVLIAADGSEIPWAAMVMHDRTYDHVRQFQFRQDAPGQAVLRVVPGEGFGDEDRRRIRSNLDRKLDGRVNFTIELVESIPLSPRGKAIYVDQQAGKDNPQRTPEC